MAFTKTPEQSTYQTKRFNFVGSPQQRSGLSGKDQRYINLFPELIKTEITENKKYFLKKRPGTAVSYTPGTTGEGRGIYYFDGHKFYAVANKLYKDTTIIATLSNSTGRVGFTEGDTATYSYLFVCDGVSAWVIQKTTGTVTQVTDADFPTPHVAQPVFIDGYVCLIKSGTGDIYNCVLEDPLSWVAGDFISAEMYPDDVIGLCKNNNYFLAVGVNNVEYFYDNANAIGSPFERNASAVLQMGCAGYETIASTEGTTIFVGRSGNGGRSVWLVEGFKATEIGIEPVKEVLDAEGTNITTAHAFTTRYMGHTWYVLNLTNRTFVYDIEEKLWVEWQYNGSVFPFNYLADNPAGTPYLIDKTSGFIVTLDETVYQDSTPSTAYSITCQVVTAKIDLDNFNRKFCHRFTLLGDVPNSAAATSISVSYSDDDYNTYSTPIALQFNTAMATAHQLGSFRRRSFQVAFTGNYPLRLEGFEIDINIGQQ